MPTKTPAARSDSATPFDPPITWQSVHAEALRRIQTREWAPGERIPDEADLAQEWGCARATVNRALRELAQAGLLERRRKGGTRVALTPVRKATFEIPIIRQDIELRGARYGYQLLSDRRLRGRVVLAREVLALHFANERPFCLEERRVNPQFAPAGQRFDQVSANEWLVQSQPYTEGHLAFFARRASEHLASHLGCAVGEALFAYRRATFVDGTPITEVTLTYAPGYELETSMGPALMSSDVQQSRGASRQRLS